MKKQSLPKKIKRRDGTLVNFNQEKIRRAIEKAALEVLEDKLKSQKIAQLILQKVIKEIISGGKERIPAVESVQDIIELILMKEGYSEIAKSYILYREKHSAIRLAKEGLGLKDDLKLPINTMEVLRQRYLLKDDRQNIIETPSQLFRRVANHVAKAEENFKSKFKRTQIEEQFYLLMRNLEFLPNSPTLMNAGTVLGQLSACFVIPVQDSMVGIFEALKDMAIIHQSGGGTGFSFSQLRPKGDLVASTKGEASGPISFMSIFDKATEVIVQGGRRRGANMGILRCDHPDIIEFIEAKLQKDTLTNFNLSVGVTDKFMEAVKKNKDFDLINPRTKKVAKKIKAKTIFDLIVNTAWQTADPGLIFLDQINRKNPIPGLGQIEATNPCGELPLLPYESCNLGSINLSKMASKNSVDWQKLKNCVHLGMRFLDNVIEVNKFPLSEIKEITFNNRKVGLGVMGFADMLIKIGIPYDSREAVRFAQKLMHFIHKESQKASLELAKERGVFPNFKKSVYLKNNLRLHNATVNTVAPTGTISMIAGCSSGIEPLFAISFVRHVLSGMQLFEINPLFEEAAKEKGIFKKAIMEKIAKYGSLKKIKEVSSEIKRIFVTAFDIKPRQHLEIQAAFQKYTDNSVSKTINLPNNATVNDVNNIYLSAHELGCKGITIYRYASKDEQVLSFVSGADLKGGLTYAETEYPGGCLVDECLF